MVVGRGPSALMECAMHPSFFEHWPFAFVPSHLHQFRHDNENQERTQFTIDSRLPTQFFAGAR